MSGFDFGSLRDPDARNPIRTTETGRGAPTKLRSEGAAPQPDTLLSRSPVIVVIAVVAGIVATRPDDDHVIVRNPSTTTTATVAPTTPRRSTAGSSRRRSTVEADVTNVAIGHTARRRDVDVAISQQLQVAQLGFEEPSA